MDELEYNPTAEEAAIMKGQIDPSTSGLPEEEQRQNTFTFFNSIIADEDNSKTANLDKDEIGMARIPVRTQQELANFCRLTRMKDFARMFESEAQIVLATSLSKEGFLDKLAVTQKREAETRIRKGTTSTAKRGWFAPKQQPEQQGM